MSGRIGFFRWLILATATATLNRAETIAIERPALITPAATLTAEGWQVVRGGVSTANWWNTLADLNATIEGRAFGAPATGQVFAQVHWVEAKHADGDFALHTGASSPVSGIMAGEQWRVYNLSYRQQATDGAWAAKIGQLAADDDFMLSEFAGLFANSAFGAMPSQASTRLCTQCGADAPFPIFSVAAPGMWVHVQPNRAWSWQAAAYHGSPGTDTRGNHGFNWGPASHGGGAFFAESVWQHPLAARAATTRVGVSAHTGHVIDFAAERVGNPQWLRRGIYSIYAVHDLVLVQDAARAPKLAVFARVGLSPERSRSAVSAYGDCGVNWFGPLAGRPADALGAALSASHFSSDFRAVTGVASTEATAELTYRARLSGRLTLQPDAQFLFRPAPNKVSGRRETAVVPGLRTQLAF